MANSPSASALAACVRIFLPIALLLCWVTVGPELSGVADEPPKQSSTPWWSLKPLAKPPPPPLNSATDSTWAHNAIDRFILARLTARGLQPAPPADRRTLLRRVTFDLIGLPPTPEELEAFLNDPAPDAYERVVNRLLASPHYGERWARHWMDVIHYAETHGHDQDVPRENAWPYRDYLIDSFNNDKPYARFIEEQIAGDILYPQDARAVVALGFLAAGPWDESSLRDIREDSLDRKAAHYLDRDDMVGTVGLTLLSTTIQCARCHDHKFDPISQKEYYGLQAVFAGVDRADRTYDSDPALHAYRQSLIKRKALLEGGPAAARLLLNDPAVARDVAAWEMAQGTRKEAWQVLDPAVFVSAGGATAVKQPDLSVRFDGLRPERDTYNFEAVTHLPAVTAVRLETMADDRLPHGGPGRQDNGNLHLSEFKIEAAPASEPARRRRIALSHAHADFNQAGWDIARAIDGKRDTAWGIYPAVGKSHAAVFVLKQPVTFPGGTRLFLTLEQQHGGGHLIGRPRLSASAMPPTALGPLPDSVEHLLARPASRRSDAEKAELALYALRSKVDTDLSALPAPRVVYAAAGDFKHDGSFKPPRGCRAVHILKRGDIRRPGAPAVPGALACVAGLPSTFRFTSNDDEGARRAALARWISDPRNTLTWRSIANRVWHHHFGRGLAASPNDFGRMGSPPTHRELLDWLAATLLEDGGSLKKLHYRIVASATYRQSSRHHAGHAKIDADNALLWRMNRTRLDAESVRDAVLQVSGRLDPKMGGPSVKFFAQSPGIHRTPKVDYLAHDPDSPGGHRRSVYRFLFRTVPDPFMDALDCPDASQFTASRADSVTVFQALALLNDPFMVRMSEHFARRVAPAGNLEGQVRRAYQLALLRNPAPHEADALAAYASRHGMANACRLVFNCNEFVFVP
jgi:hypothetical protein